MDTESPDTPTAEASFMSAERAMIGTLLGGTGAMRAAGAAYLPKHPAEGQDSYAYRLSISTLYNAMSRTVETMAGKPFSEPLKLNQDVPAQIVKWCEDFDLQGRSLQRFSFAVFADAMANGIAHILIDYPLTAPGATLADKAATGARPYGVHIKQDQVLGWRSTRINGQETLTMLRIMENVTEPSGIWGTVTIPQIRVIEPTKWTTYRKNAVNEWLPYMEGAWTLGRISLATVYTGRTNYMQAKPPLLDLAHLNVEHWQSSSDQSNILHVARVPILFASGFKPDGLVIAANSAVANEDPNSKLMYVEHSGKAIEAGQASLKDLELRMSIMGAQLLVRQPGTVTATEKAIDSAEADSELGAMVENLEDSIAVALQFMSDWEGLGPAGTVELTGDLTGIDALEVTTLLRARELGLLSAETVFDELQRRGLVSDDIKWMEEAARLGAETPAPQMFAKTLPKEG